MRYRWIYIGSSNAIDIILNGLETLEYRGYDSSGIAFLDNNKIDVVKTVGRISNLREKLESEYKDKISNIGVGHTRWVLNLSLLTRSLLRCNVYSV